MQESIDSDAVAMQHKNSAHSYFPAVISSDIVPLSA